MLEGDFLTKTGKYEALCSKLSEAPRDSSFQENACREINETMGFLWTGFYFVQDDRLILGPYFGPPACEMIRKGKGVCGTSWAENRTIIVPDVEEFPGHIACSSLSRSEIVIPLRDSEGNVTGVLDIDSEHLDNFDNVDKEWLEKISLLF